MQLAQGILRSISAKSILNSLTLEELIDLLDDEISRAEGRPVRNRAVDLGKAPFVIASRWNSLKPDSSTYGFFVANHGEPAFRIEMSDLTLIDQDGKELLLQQIRPFNCSLLKEHKEQLIESIIIEYRDHFVVGSYLPRLIWSTIEKTANSNGFKVPIMMTMTYRDGGDNLYMTRHELTVADQDSPNVTVSCINVEMVTKQP